MTIVPFSSRSAAGGSGSGGPDMETRVARLESDMQEVKASLKIIERAVLAIEHLPTQSEHAALKADVARIDGRVAQLPTAWTMFTSIVTTIVATWTAGATIVFTLLRFARP